MCRFSDIFDFFTGKVCSVKIRNCDQNRSNSYYFKQKIDFEEFSTIYIVQEYMLVYTFQKYKLK